jgi:hypothetical protein
MLLKTLKNLALTIMSTLVSLLLIAGAAPLLLSPETVENALATGKDPMAESLLALGPPYICTVKGMGPGVKPVLPAFPNCYTLKEMRRHGILMDSRLISQERREDEYLI